MSNQLNLQSIQQIISQSDNEVELEIDKSKVHLTHLEKVLWPKQGRDDPAGRLKSQPKTTRQIVSTKRDLALYWIDHWSEAKKHLIDRPITVVRCIEGVVKDCFYQRHFDEELPKFVQTVEIWTEDKNSDQRYLMINNLATLLWLANREIIEIHTWLSQATNYRKTEPTGSKKNLERSDLNYPDLILFDLDPHLPTQVETPRRGVLNVDQRRPSGSSLREVWQILTDELNHRKMKFWTKTTGLGGLHVLVPIRRTKTFEQTRGLAKEIALKLAADHPEQITASYREEDKEGKILIDYSQNAIGKSFVLLHSPRVSKEFTSSEEIKSSYSIVSPRANS